jgi:predicted aminopeptidase
VNGSSIAFRLVGAIVLAAVILPVGGCYELQAAAGQARLMFARRPIVRVLQNPKTPAKLRAQLERVNDIRDFASRELGLPDNGSYRSYADTGRSYVVWNVFAAPEFSVEARQWCYPIVGCVAYRGYFSELAARRFGDGLRAQGDDVAVGGVAAYSTLGHFDDPILNTMMGWDDVELAAIVFHELTHQLIYVADDSSFNESLASFVEAEGVRRWLKSRGREEDLARYEERQRRYELVTQLLIEARAGLAALYASGLDADAMRVAKRAAFAALRASYENLRAGWQGEAPFDAWFAADLNNAHLVSVATYASCVPGFARELEGVGGDLPRFYVRVRELSRLPKDRRDAVVCGGPDP